MGPGAASCAGCGAGLLAPPPNCIDNPPRPDDDAWVQRSRVETSDFIEVLEVRAYDDGKTLFCSGVKGLNVIDAQNPDAPVRTAGPLASARSDSSYPRCQHLARLGDLVFVSSRGDEIQPDAFLAGFDLSAAPVAERMNLSLGEVTIEGLAARPGFLFGAAHADGLVAWSVSDNALAEVGTFGSDGALANAWAVAVWGDRLVVVDVTGELVVVDAADPGAMVELGRVEIGGSPQSVEIDHARDLAFVAAGGGGLVVVDLSSPESPVEIGSLQTPGTALQVALSSAMSGAGEPSGEASDFAYVADWTGALVVDIRSGSSPTLVASEIVDVPEAFPRILGIGARGLDAYLGEWTGLYVYSLFEGRTAPDLRPQQTSVHLPQTPVGETSAAVIALDNVGTAPLEITGVELVAESPTIDFEVSPTTLTIEPGASNFLEVAFTPSSSELSWSRAVLCSNDPDRPAFSVDLLGNLSRNEEGDVADEVAITVVSGPAGAGTTWRLSEQRGQTVLLAYFATF